MKLTGLAGRPGLEGQAGCVVEERVDPAGRTRFDVRIGRTTLQNVAESGRLTAERSC